MLADFVLKGIDNLFSQKLSLQPQKKVFTKEIIKQNLQNVVRKGNPQKSFTRTQNTSPNNKSRLRTILQHNKEQKIRSVVKRNKEDRSASPTPYTKIQSSSTKKERGGPRLNNCESMMELQKDQSLISFYREQRKTVQKSRISETSVASKNKSRIFPIHEPINTKDISKDMIQIPFRNKFEMKH